MALSWDIAFLLGIIDTVFQEQHQHLLMNSRECNSISKSYQVETFSSQARLFLGLFQELIALFACYLVEIVWELCVE